MTKKNFPKNANKSTTRWIGTMKRIKQKRQQRLSRVICGTGLDYIIRNLWVKFEKKNQTKATSCDTIYCGMFLSSLSQPKKTLKFAPKEFPKAIKTFLIFVSDPSNRICIEKSIGSNQAFGVTSGSISMDCFLFCFK